MPKCQQNLQLQNPQPCSQECSLGTRPSHGRRRVWWSCIHKNLQCAEFRRDESDRSIANDCYTTTFFPRKHVFPSQQPWRIGARERLKQRSKRRSWNLDTPQRIQSSWKPWKSSWKGKTYSFPLRRAVESPSATVVCHLCSICWAAEAASQFGAWGSIKTGFEEAER